MIHSAHHKIDLLVVLIALKNDAPYFTTLHYGDHLPPELLTSSHHSLQKQLHTWTEERSGCAIGHMEQLYTFADHIQHTKHQQIIRISYLALAKDAPDTPIVLHPLYHYFPWEDRRFPDYDHQYHYLRMRIMEWAQYHSERHQRAVSTFGQQNFPWDDEKVLDRYELLWEANLTPQPSPNAFFDDRRIIATALSRLRAKIRYTPIVFTVLPTHFTLLQLQHTMETLSGRLMHKSNFRRLVLHQHLVEETGLQAHSVTGRPAKLYHFRPSTAMSCYLSGAKLPLC